VLRYQESLPTDYLVDTASVDRIGLFTSKLAQVSFFLYLFFAFFGTSMPFQEQTRNVEDITTSNAVNQFVFSLLYLLSFIGLLSKRHLIIRFLKTEKFLSLLLLWSFLSVFWSDFPFVSLKRWIQIFGTSVIFLSALLHFRSDDEALRYFKVILMAYIPLTFLAILLIPGAIQWEFPALRGLAPHKNMLGQVSLVSLIVWSFAAKVPSLRKKIAALLFWGLSFVLLVGSKSTTSILTAGGLLLLGGLWYTGEIFLRPTVGRTLSSVVLLLFLVILFSIAYVGSDIVASLFHFFGKDMTLTGRIDLWAAVFEETKKHLLFGCGFGGFWIADSPAMDTILEEFVWLPNQSHLGYLDILNETGVVGISLLALMMVSYFKNLLNFEGTHFWKWFVIAALIANISESTLFRPNELTGELLILSYLALYVQAIRSKGGFP